MTIARLMQMAAAGAGGGGGGVTLAYADAVESIDGSSPFTVTLMGTVNSGDLLVFYEHLTVSSGVTLTTAAPSGWTYAAGQTSATGGTGTEFLKIALYYKIADGSEGGTTLTSNITSGSATGSRLRVLRFTGGVSTITVGGATSGYDASSGFSIAASGGTAPQLVIFSLGVRTSGSFSSQSVSSGVHAQFSGDDSATYGYDIQNSSASDITVSFSASSAPNYAYCWLKAT